MSVITTFDERREDAKNNIATAIKNLQVCLQEDTFGHSSMSNQFIDELVQMVADLMKMKRKL